jgi:hypothetical protein
MELWATKGEIALVAFVFVLIYASGVLARAGEKLGRALQARSRAGRKRE